MFDDRTNETDSSSPGDTNDADLGAETWIEVGRGFPAGGIGAEPIEESGYEMALVTTPDGAFTGFDAARVVAFTEFLAGTAFDADEREWLIDAMAREFADDPANAIEQLAPIENAVEVIPDLDPIERATNRLKALTSMYQTEPIRERLEMAETPVMMMLKAHNPALVIDRTGVVVVSDAIDARREINDLVLSLGGRSLDQLPNLRADMVSTYLTAAAPMKAELAGSQVRLVTLRAWLALQPQNEIDQLRARMRDVIDTATDLDMVTMQLCFRSTIEALVG
jgi:hypothetical protein